MNLKYLVKNNNGSMPICIYFKMGIPEGIRTITKRYLDRLRVLPYVKVANEYANELITLKFQEMIIFGMESRHDLMETTEPDRRSVISLQNLGLGKPASKATKQLLTEISERYGLTEEDNAKRIQNGRN